MSDVWAARLQVTHVPKIRPTVTTERVTQPPKVGGRHKGPMRTRMTSGVKYINPNLLKSPMPPTVAASRLTSRRRIELLHQQQFGKPIKKKELKEKAENEVRRRKSKSSFEGFLDQVGDRSQPKNRNASDVGLHKPREKRRRSESYSKSQRIEDIVIDEGSAFSPGYSKRHGREHSVASCYNALRTHDSQASDWHCPKRKSFKVGCESGTAREPRNGSEETDVVTLSNSSPITRRPAVTKRSRRRDKPSIMVPLSIDNEVFSGVRSSSVDAPPSKNRSNSRDRGPKSEKATFSQHIHCFPEDVFTTGVDASTDRIDLTALSDGESERNTPTRESAMKLSRQKPLASISPLISGKVGNIEHGRTSPIPSQRGLSLPNVDDSNSDSSGENAHEILHLRRSKKPVTERPRRLKHKRRTTSHAKAKTNFSPAVPASKEEIVEEILDGDSAQEVSPTPVLRTASPQPVIVIDDSPSPKGRNLRRRLTSRSCSEPSPVTLIPPDRFYGKRLRRSARLSRPVHLSESEEEIDESLEEEIRFRLASKAERGQLRALTFQLEDEEVVAKIKEANIELKAEDFRRLGGSCWLSDELINSFVALVNERNQAYCVSVSTGASLDGPRSSHSDEVRAGPSTQHFKVPSCELPPLQVKEICKEGPSSQEIKYQDTIEGTESSQRCKNHLELFDMSRPRAHIFNTFFYPRLVQGGYDYSGVKRWLKRAGRKITELDLIMVPININNIHWVLAAIDMRGKHFLYFDSTNGPDCLDSLNVLRRWLKDEVEDKCGEEKAEQLNIDSWTSKVNPAYVPKQLDDGSCGIFAIYIAEFLERGIKPNFTQQNIRALRQRTALFLINCRLPES